MANNIYQKLIADILGTRQIAFNPDLARITKSVEAGLLLSQLLYWHKKGRNPEWFYKTIEEIKEETYLTRSQQDTAIKKCKKLGLVEVKLKGIPRKRYFNIRVEKIVEQLKNTNWIAGSRQQARAELAKRIDLFKPAITESTQKLHQRIQTETEARTGFKKVGDILKKYEINSK